MVSITFDEFHAIRNRQRASADADAAAVAAAAAAAKSSPSTSAGTDKAEESTKMAAKKPNPGTTTTRSALPASGASSGYASFGEEVEADGTAAPASGSVSEISVLLRTVLVCNTTAVLTALLWSSPW